ncbi:MAG: NUDIX domain-containing protein [Chthoniobacterales bacterium]|nr:NUDIX domain-containing protein [Chthoniobacterales bacterium]
MLRNLLLDWSGTLVDDLPPVIGATNFVLGHYGRPPLTRDEFRRHFRLPFTEFYAEFLPEVPLADLDAMFHSRFVEIQDEVAPLPGLVEFLEFCRTSGRRLFLLSSMKQAHYEVQVAKLGLAHYFEHPYVGVLDKRAKIGEILATHGLERGETAFVGDMIHDVETARHGGVMSIAMLTGYDSIEKLTPAKPDVVVVSLHELRHLLEHDADLRPVATVGALIGRDGKLLMIRTRKWSGKWGIPGGKIERGEAAEDALRREVLEETGLRLRDVRFVMAQDCVDSEEFHRPAHFLLLNYTADAESGEVRLNEEAEEFRWVTPAEAAAMDLNRPTRRLLEAVHRPS